MCIRDRIITVCDNAAGEVCPIWPGHPATAHWAYADPSEGEGGPEQCLERFRNTLKAIRSRLEALLAASADLAASEITDPASDGQRLAQIARRLAQA